MSEAVATKEAVLLVEKQGPLAWLKLNRPEVLNCLNRALLRELIEQCNKLAQDKEVRVVAIIGSGSRVFCAGADLAERKGMSEGDTIDYIGLINQAMRAVETLPQPVIAAINGSAFGGGTELALACDLRVMMHDTQLRLTEVKLGIIPGAGGTQRLPRLIGKSKAKEMILTASPIGAEEGKTIGLIHKVVDRPADEEIGSGFSPSLMAAVSHWANEIAENAPLSLKQAKFAIDEGFDRDLEAGLALETKAYIQLLNTKDRQEGLKAFAEKRKPQYKGE
ncbi:MAG: enoyl-CoA hydratase/isomerase family protein [Cyanobacteria bacterium]|nr:enoyl-CoA hydratase/isomerase family protein [Cyanobacteriota bacterium]